MADENGKKKLAPYPPFKTFLATLDSFANFMPHKIDASVWPSYSGGIKSQLLSAYRFLGLVAEDGTPTEELRLLCNDKVNRPALLKEVLKKGYSALFSHDLSKATPNSFDAEMRKYGFEGDTHRKATAFFMAAAKYSNIRLSPLLTKRGSMSATRKRKSSSSRRPGGAGDNSDNGNGEQESATGPVKTILLENGIALSLGTTADMFQMSSRDRQFVFGLLEKMEQYEAEHKNEENPEENA